MQIRNHAVWLISHCGINVYRKRIASSEKQNNQIDFYGPRGPQSSAYSDSRFDGHFPKIRKPLIKMKQMFPYRRPSMEEATRDGRVLDEFGAQAEKGKERPSKISNVTLLLAPQNGKTTN